MLEEPQQVLLNKQSHHPFSSRKLPEPTVIASAMFLLSLLVYILFIPKVMHSWRPTGDEPHYLVITKSLVYDHDIDLRNNYDQGPDIPHIVARPNGSWSPAHDIGLPIVMYLPYVIGGEFGVYILLAIISALIASSTFLLAYELTNRLSVASLAYLFTAFLPPTFLYAFQIYPETLGALLLIWSVRFLVRDHLTKLQWILVGVWAGCMPWLVGRFAPLSVFITLAGIYSIYKNERQQRRTAIMDIACLVIPEMVLAAVYVLFLLRFYGSPSPMALHPSPGLASPSQGILGFIQLFLGWLVDQRMSIFIFSPILILSISGMILIWQQKLYRYRLLVVLILIYYLILTILSDGFWVQFSIPTRYLLIVIPLIVACSSYAIVAIKNLLFRIFAIIFVIISVTNAYMVISNQGLAYSVYFNKSPLVKAYSRKVGIDLTNLFPLVEEPAVTLKFNMDIGDADKPIYYTAGLFIPGFDVLQGSVIADPGATFGRAAYMDQVASSNGPWLAAVTQVEMPVGEVLIQVRARYLGSGSELSLDSPAFTLIVTGNEPGHEIQREVFRLGELETSGDYKLLNVTLANPQLQALHFTIVYSAPLPIVLDYMSYKSSVRWWPSWGLTIFWCTMIALFTCFAVWRRAT